MNYSVLRVQAKPLSLRGVAHHCVNWGLIQTISNLSIFLEDSYRQMLLILLRLPCFRIGTLFVSLVLSLLLAGLPVRDKNWMAIAATPTTAIAKWPNGRYQLCSQPEPSDWKDGAGVCVVFSKAANKLDGYYGYPHSDRYICLRGSITDSSFKGEGLAFTWFTTPTPKISSLEKQWDTEGRMRVDQAQILKLEAMEDGWASWVRFGAATLDLKGLYRYTAPKMRPASELCNW